MTDGPRILVADDEALHRSILARAIASAGLKPTPRIVQAADGIEALEALRSGVDLAFLDIRMPGMTGLEVLKTFRAETKAETPIVIVSSSSDPRDVNAATRLGIHAYIEKGRYPDFRVRVVQTLDGWSDQRDPSKRS